jgi:hypothetical protein
VHFSFSFSFCCSHVPFFVWTQQPFHSLSLCVAPTFRSIHFTSLLSLAESHTLLQHFFPFLEPYAHNLYNWIKEHNFHEKLNSANLAVLPHCLLSLSA